MTYWPGTKIIKSTNNDFDLTYRHSIFLKDRNFNGNSDLLSAISKRKIDDGITQKSIAGLSKIKWSSFGLSSPENEKFPR